MRGIQYLQRGRFQKDEWEFIPQIAFSIKYSSSLKIEWFQIQDNLWFLHGFILLHEEYFFTTPHHSSLSSTPPHIASLAKISISDFLTFPPFYWMSPLIPILDELCSVSHLSHALNYVRFPTLIFWLCCGGGVGIIIPGKSFVWWLSSTRVIISQITSSWLFQQCGNFLTMFKIDGAGRRKTDWTNK